MCILIRMLIMNDDDYCHHCTLYLGVGRALGSADEAWGPHPGLPGGRWPVCLSRLQRHPEGPAQAHTAAPQEEESPTHHHLLWQAFPVPSLSWATHLIPLSIMVKNEVLGTRQAGSECELCYVIWAQLLCAHLMGSF